jgi:hypothetical protein
MYNKKYWWQTKKFAYYRIPKQLIGSEKYKNLSSNAVLLYGLLLDRMSLSGTHVDRFTDAEGFIFVYFTNAEVCKCFNCGHDKATKLFRELECYGLIERRRQGKGYPVRIYVKPFDFKR